MGLPFFLAFLALFNTPFDYQLLFRLTNKTLHVKELVAIFFLNFVLTCDHGKPVDIASLTELVLDSTRKAIDAFRRQSS